MDTAQPPTTPALNPATQDYTQVSEKVKQDNAFQYYGYPALSEWMASSNDFFVIRKFGPLAARSLLGLQNEIAQKEKWLKKLDAYSMSPAPGFGGCGSFRQDADPSSPRGLVLAEVRPLLKEYYDLANAFANVKSRPTANSDQRTNLRDWFRTYPNAIDIEEQHFLLEENQLDLFSIVSKPKTPLAIFLQKARLLRLPFKLRDRESTKHTVYYSGTGFEIAVNIVIVLLGLIFLFVPMWWLHFVQDHGNQLGIITGFIASFTMLLGLAAGPRAFEILAGAAAYSAVLMVYLQIQNP